MNIKHTMMTLPLLCAGCLIAVTGCDNRQSGEPSADRKVNTVETVRTEGAVQDYSQNPTARNKVEVQRALAELEGEINELEVRAREMTGEDRVKAEEKIVLLRRQHDELKSNFNEARFEALKRDVGDYSRDLVNRLGRSVERAGEKMQDGGPQNR